VYENLVIPTDDYWLGGTDEVQEKDWRWITGAEKFSNSDITGTSIQVLG